MPGHVEDAAEVLRTAADTVPVQAVAGAEEQLTAIATTVTSAGAALDETLADRCRALAMEARTFAGRLADLREALNAAANQIGSAGGPGEPVGAKSSSKSSVSPAPRPSRPATTVQHQDGSRYPVEASWAVPTLPRRVGLDGQTTTVGRIKIGNREIPGEMRSGEWDRWSDAAAERVDDLGLRIPGRLVHHVEMRVAAMLVDSRVRDAELVINNTCCGFETRPVGCHQVLDRFLPDGYRLTVYGTDRSGKPFQRTYGATQTT